MSGSLELIKHAETLPSLLAALAPVRRAEIEKAPTAQLAKTVEMTDKVRDALMAVANAGTAINVGEHRQLTSDEATALMAERQLFDVIEKYIKERRDAQKAMGYHHLDAELEETDAEIERDKEGFAVVAGRIPVPSIGKSFSREVKGGGEVLTAEALEKVVDRKDYMAMTREVRVLDENKVVLHLRRHPELGEKIAPAITRSPKSTSFNIR